MEFCVRWCEKCNIELKNLKNLFFIYLFTSHVQSILYLVGGKTEILTTNFSRVIIDLNMDLILVIEMFRHAMALYVSLSIFRKS